LNDYVANVVDDYHLHVVADGDRFMINLKTGQVDKLVVSTMSCTTMDFRTQYTFEQLRENILTNLKQCMMNQIVQEMVNNLQQNPPTITVNPLLKDVAGKNLYLEMFSDIHSLDNYVLVTGQGAATKDYKKFAEVFKNNVKDIDESGIGNGLAFKTLNAVVDDTFKSGS
jgi:hypothetical protein